MSTGSPAFAGDDSHIGSALAYVATFAFAALAIPTPAHAQDYPTRPITIVSAQASGGASDTVTRAIQERLQTALGQPIVLENRPGASGNVGAAAVARSTPDGYTLMVGTDAMMTSNVHLFKSMPFDPVKDFAPITNGGTNIIVMAVHADVPVKSVSELVAYAKANPGKLQFGSSGIASPHHLAGELLKLKTGIDIVHVPYRGANPAMQDLMSGRVDYLCDIITTAKPQIDAGTVKAIAILTKERSPVLPNVPTAIEQGFDVEAYTWNAFFLPNGTPAPIADRLHAAAEEAMNDPAVAKRLAELGASVAETERRTPAYLQQFVASEIVKWAAPIKASGAKAE